MSQPTPTLWGLRNRLYKNLKAAEFDLKHDPEFENTKETVEPLYTSKQLDSYGLARFEEGRASNDGSNSRI